MYRVETVLVLTVLPILLQVLGKTLASAHVDPADETDMDADTIGIHSDGSGYQNPSLDVIRGDHICRSEACVSRGALMLQAMNTSVDPCDNFFLYACGNWITVHPIPPASSSWTTFKQMQQQLEIKLQNVMEITTTDSSTARQKAKKVYATCMNLTNMEDQGAAPFIATMNGIMGSWPLLDSSWKSSEFDVLEMYSKFSRAGQTYLHTVKGDTNEERPGENILVLDEMSLGLPKKMYLQQKYSKVRDAYLALMKNLTTILSKDVGVGQPADIDQQFQEIMQFESLIANISYTPEERRDPHKLIHLMTLNDFHDKHFNKTFSKTSFIMALRNMTENSTIANAIQLNLTVNVVNPKYQEHLDQIWFERLNGPNSGKTGKRFIANYLGWRMLRDAAVVLPKRYRDAYFEYNKLYSGVTGEDLRSTTCARYTNKAMPLAVGSMYVANNFAQDSKEKLLQVAKDMKEAFTTMITEAPWMDNKTRTIALSKLAAMSQYIAYADFLLLDLPRLDLLYQDYEITDVHYLNDQQIKMQHTAESFALILKNNSNNIDETVNPAEVNAFYDTRNVLALLAGIVQPPIFHKDYPQYLNYASLGFLFGHEMTHGFDDQGSLYDEHGGLSAWYTNATLANFNARVQTIVKQYSAYETVAGFINGEITAGENIADNGGVKQSYMAFKSYLARLNGTSPLLLPGLENMSVEKVFFLAGAQSWCGIERLEYLKNSVLLDVHSPNQYRVIGALSNLPEFGVAFNCSVGSRMNPVERAGVW